MLAVDPPTCRRPAFFGLSRSVRRGGGFLLAIAAACGGLVGCAYRIEGKVVAGDADFVTIVDADDPRLSMPGVGGTRISFVRDPMRLNRAVAAKGVSDPEGEISIPIDAFGAGWLEEEWLVQAVRSDRGAAEGMVSLPRGGRRLLIMLRSASPQELREIERSWREQGDLMQEASRWSR